MHAQGIMGCSESRHIDCNEKFKAIKISCKMNRIEKLSVNESKKCRVMNCILIIL